MAITVAATPSRMGRRPLDQTSVTQPTMVRLTVSVRERITALVGANGMAAFIREAIEEKLASSEPPSPSPNPQPKDREGETKE